MRIWKYTLHLCDWQKVDIPEGAEVVHLQLQDELVNLWAKVDVNQPKMPMDVYRIETGAAIPARATYIGTVVMPNRMVWHYFWRMS